MRARNKRDISLGICFAALLILLCFWLWSWRYHAFDDDEFQHAHVGWLLAQGERPYADFFEHHLVFYHLLLFPFIWFFDGGSLLFAGRTLSLATGFSVLYLLYLGGRRLGAGVWASGAGVLLLGLVPMFQLKMVELRPVGAGILCLALAVYFLLRLDGRDDSSGNFSKRTGKVLFIGVLAGLMVLLSQKMVFMGIGLVLVMYFRDGLRSALRMVLAASLIGFAYVGGILLIGAGREFWDSVIVMNLQWRRNFSPAAYLTELYQTAGPFLIIGLLGLFQELGRSRRRLDAITLLILLVAALAQVLLIPVPFRQAFLPLLLVLAFGAQIFLEECLGLLRVHGLSWRADLLAALCLLLLCLPSLSGLQIQLRETNRDDLLMMKNLAGQLSPGRPVFDGRGLMVSHPHVGYHACMHEGILLMLDDESYSRNLLKSFRDYGYPPVIMDYRVRQLPLPVRSFFDDYYHADAALPRLLRFGYRVDRGRLSGRGLSLKMEPGWYRVEWSGGRVFFNGRELSSGEVFPVEAGNYELSAEGFVRKLSFLRDYGREES